MIYVPHTVRTVPHVRRTHTRVSHIRVRDLASRTRESVAERMNLRETARKDICGGRCLKRAVEDSLDFFRDLSFSLSFCFLLFTPFPPHVLFFFWYSLISRNLRCLIKSITRVRAETDLWFVWNWFCSGSLESAFIVSICICICMFVALF